LDGASRISLSGIVSQEALSATPEHVSSALPPSTRPTRWETAWSAWRSPRLFALVLLALAFILGAFYRFHRLARWDMNGDEGIAWAAVIRPTLREVSAAFWRFENGGKLPLFDIVLHEWVRIFGDSLFAMPAMSAALGTL